MDKEKKEKGEREVKQIPHFHLKAHWLSPARIRATTLSRTPTGYFFVPFTKAP